MSDLEKLAAIRARCVELLELAGKRTPGKWELGIESGEAMLSTESDLSVPGVCDANIYDQAPAVANLAFIASCAGPAEAGWRATIAAIDLHLEMISMEESRRFSPSRIIQESRNNILAAWEGQV